jgi:hypothetical protein
MRWTRPSLAASGNNRDSGISIEELLPEVLLIADASPPEAAKSQSSHRNKSEFFVWLLCEVYQNPLAISVVTE